MITWYERFAFACTSDISILSSQLAFLSPVFCSITWPGILVRLSEIANITYIFGHVIQANARPQTFSPLIITAGACLCFSYFLIDLFAVQPPADTCGFFLVVSRKIWRINNFLKLPKIESTLIFNLILSGVYIKFLVQCSVLELHDLFFK